MNRMELAQDTRFEVFTAMEIQVAVFGDGGSMVLRNVGILPHHVAAS
jgi:hypothetical protein